ncbi:MAG TPA: fimbria/pilus periplasmic chaperone [Solimonas sp.]|nr:fimbria/pilus periplasmic chaperone [Solimonas sp.]
MFRSFRGALGAVLLLFAGLAPAASLRVAPLQVDLGKGQPIGRLQLFNDGNSDMVVDLRVRAWKIVDDRDVLSSTDEVIAVPPVARVPAGGQQLVRVGFRRPDLPGDVERSYRLVVTELPRPNPGPAQLQLQLRLLIPVFVAPRAPPQPALSLRLREEQGRLQLDAANAGNVHAKLTSLALRDGRLGTLLSLPLNAYVMPGQSRSLPLSTPLPAAAIESAQALVLQGAQQRPEIQPIELP